MYSDLLIHTDVPHTQMSVFTLFLPLIKKLQILMSVYVC